MPEAPLRPSAIDLAVDPDPAAALHSALTTHGFVAVRNTAVSAVLRDQAFASAREYFAQPASIKAQDAYSDTQANFGYQGMLSEALDPQETADLKEAFTMRSLKNSSQVLENSEQNKKRPASAPALEADSQSIWRASEFGATATQLYQACSDAAMDLLALIAKALNAPADTFATHHTGENMTLRYLHYPALPRSDHLSTGSVPTDEAKNQSEDKKMHQLGAGAHTDYGTITLLFSDGVAGLQLFDVSNGNSTGCWRDVEVAPGDVLVNTGDLMSLWSNGLYPSTLHRVQPRLEKPDRYSMAFFVDPDSSTRVSPLPSCINSESSDAHPTTANVVVAGEHIQARIEASQRTLA